MTCARRASRRARVALGLLLLLPAACTTLRRSVPFRDATPGRTTFHTVHVGTRARTFLLHLPPAAARGRVPLVLLFHGHTGNAEIMRRSTRMNAAADSMGMAVAYMNGTGRVRGVALSWNVSSCCGWAQRHDVDELAFVDSVRATLGRTALIDTTEVFAAGFSAGGMLALQLACQRSGVIRAVADIAGAMPNAPCTPSQPVAVLLVRGDDDDLLEDHAEQAADGAPPYGTSLDSAMTFWERVNRCSGRVRQDGRAPLPSLARSRVATGCAAGASVEIVSIPSHPHAWPGGGTTWWFGQRPSPAINGSALVLSFFRAQRDGSATF